MKAAEILQTHSDSKTLASWLKEIAYQLARLNESEDEPKPLMIPPETPVKRGPGRPPKSQ